ncbi:uncharacterized protein [Rutidosis leptorrhynchoides]|uniref:uncharacterized protein n=1 Tax=Rutidosis leptorrhynchoides TaxID=125765 RepID=UPI003A99A58E
MCATPRSCFHCGSTEHLGRDCSSPFRLCFYCYGNDHLKADCPKLKEDMKRVEQRKEAGRRATAGVLKPKSRSFQLTTEEAKKFGTFIVNNMPTHVLFDSGAIKSFVSLSFCERFNLPLCKLDVPLEVEIADSKLVIVSDIYRGCIIEINDEQFKIDLIPMKMGEFHVVIGMDWLGDHKGTIKCHKKIVRLRGPSGKKMIIYDEQSRQAIPICSYARAK